ncbi:hypothetical protein QFC21_005674 [Naganishia friedmannii]|uniref:Uncharacterized protein n=1 Tax=Naganishia friedmannii TaxID=89922 RepID=A0ACC2V851_9TREE|nr:hypothetical protein QFC21_005674 [Naganishia friedmannii]
MSSSSPTPRTSTPPPPAPTLETLPLELISQILTYLPLNSLLPLSTLSRTLLFISSDPTVTPFPASITQELDAGPPYSRELEVLGTYSHIPRSCFIQILVRASPEWVLDSMVIPGGITTSEWRECFERRFLPSWKRYKFRNHHHHVTPSPDGKGDHTWRATFLRVLRTLVHRQLGCTHEEAWTRFLILHRNGTASLNRIYSRTFDPLEIYAEIRRQNALLGPQFKQEARLVCQFQDFRVVMLGSVADPARSLFVNPNAYVLLHPPGVEEVVVVDDGDDGRREEGTTVWARMDEVALPHTPTPTNAVTPVISDQPRATGNTLQPPPPPHTRGTSTGLSNLVNKLRVGASKSSSSQDAAAASTNVIADSSAIKRPRTGDRRQSSFLSRTLSRDKPTTTPTTGTTTTTGGVLSLVRTRTRTGDTGVAADGAGEREREEVVSASSGAASGGGGLRRRLSLLTRSRSRDAATSAQAQIRASEDGTTVEEGQERALLSSSSTGEQSLPVDTVNLDSMAQRLGAGTTENTVSDPRAPTAFTDPTTRHPVSTYQQQQTSSSAPLAPRAPSRDFSDEMLPYPILTHPQPAASHALYPNYTPFDLQRGGTGVGVRDTRQGRLVAPFPARKYLPMSVPVGAEWEEGEGWKAWVGPVLLFAQLSSAAHAPNDTLRAEILDGPIPPFDFGPRGMYASFDWEDLDALAPWLELREVENGNDGMDVDAPAGAGSAGGAALSANRSAGVHRAGLGFAR